MARLFDDPILGNSAMERLANPIYQIVIWGTSHREWVSPHLRLVVPKEGIELSSKP